MNTSIEIRLVSSPLSFAEAPAGYPKKNNRKRAGTMGRGKRRESLAPNFLLLLFPLSIAPLSPPPPPPPPPRTRFLFLPLQPSLRYKEALAEERVPSRYLSVCWVNGSSEKIGVRLAPQLNPNLLFGHESELRW